MYDVLNIISRSSFSFTGWQQLQLLRKIDQSDQLKHHTDYTVWFSSPNEALVRFCLFVVRHYKHYHALKALNRLLYHSSSRLRAEVVIAIRELEGVDYLDALVKNFTIEDQAVQVEIIKTAGKLGDAGHIPFLQKVMANKPHAISMAAARAVLAIKKTPEILKTDDKLYSEANRNAKQIFDHVIDNT
jgi:hypothetical protein